MKEKDQKKQIAKISVFITSIFVIFLSVTYAFINQTLTGTKRQVITAGNLELELQEDENNLTITNAMPMYDEVGMIQEAFTFRLMNKTATDTNYIIKLVDIETGEKLDTNIVKYGLTKDGVSTIKLLSTLRNGKIDSGKILGNQTINYSLRLWIDSSVEGNTTIEEKSLSYRIDVEVSQDMGLGYQDEILNGCDPVLSENLVPVKIEDDGTVRKADIEEEWYNYSKQEWANAVVLEDKNQEYNIGDIIPEDNIQSYFVWIPRYKYKLFNMGNSSGLTSITNAEQTIEVVFESKDITPSLGTKVGDYHSHPAFQAFDTNGFWVGKFESGYKGATTTEEAGQNNSDPSNLVIKPNTYSWRSITVGNAFKTSYDYMRHQESHMMKNTEWGAVAYLQHSEYGSRASVRVNNNTSYLTGYASVSEPTCGPTTNNVSSSCNPKGTDVTITQKYNTPTGYTASTTGNITGIYDMAGGSWEYVMGYNTNASTVGGASEITSIYSDFFTNKDWEKYYDKYSSTTDTMYNARILGDATGEIGGFANVTAPNGSAYYTSSWYGDYGYSATAALPWFARGGAWSHGSLAGVFTFDGSTGGVRANASFRVVLTP